MRILINNQPVEIIDDGKKYAVNFRYNVAVKDEIKRTFEGATWDVEKKKWTISKSNHNELQLAWYRGEDPFKHYKQPVRNFVTKRNLFSHQQEFTNILLTYRRVIGAIEMGGGKTICFIESAEISNYDNIWYVAPKSGISAVNRELIKWNARFDPTMMTYEGMTKRVKEGVSDLPDYIFFDECSRLKTPTSNRSKAALELVRQVKDRNPEAIVFMGSGSPSPKSPTDWWMLGKICCEGFIKEASAKKFEERLSVQKMFEYEEGKAFNKVLFWLDNENKCKHCGKLQNDDHEGHYYTKSINEVANLFNRLKGLVYVKLKKDCLDLPDKIYEVIELKPTSEMLRAVKALKAIESKGAQLASKMQQLSDGFLYTDKVVGNKTCELCKGSKKSLDPISGLDTICIRCEGTGQEDLIERIAIVSPTPKDEALLEQLEDHSDIGRIIVWAGFIASVDKITKMILKEGWHVIQIDGRGALGFSPDGSEVSSEDLLIAMDKSHPKWNEKYEKVAFVGNPIAGGVALTLTASPSAIYYSNSYSGESRWQSEDRNHRIGITASPRVIDFVSLPIDRMVLKVLKQKKDLQSISLGEILESC